MALSLSTGLFLQSPEGEAIDYSIFDKKEESHPTSVIYVYNFPSDLRASCYLLLGGYYRQSIASLRSWLEMYMIGMYYGVTHPNPKEFSEWMQGNKNIFFGTYLIKRIFENSKFRKGDPENRLRDEIVGLYKQLSAITHGAGMEKYDLVRFSDNVPRYNSHSVDIWFDFVQRVFSVIVNSMYLSYGNIIFHALDENEVSVIAKFAKLS